MLTLYYKSTTSVLKMTKDGGQRKKKAFLIYIVVSVSMPTDAAAFESWMTPYQV